jgi:hypothetical protein
MKLGLIVGVRVGVRVGVIVGEILIAVQSVLWLVMSEGLRELCSRFFRTSYRTCCLKTELILRKIFGPVITRDKSRGSTYFMRGQ